MPSLRELENRIFGAARQPESALVEDAERRPWDTRWLAGHKYCLLTSYRKNGTAVHTPVWFGVDGDRLYVRSGSDDGKVKRIRGNAQVLIAPCTARGRPLGAPMVGRARLLEPAEWDRAEAALVRAYSFGRRFYRVVRRRIAVAYLEVGP